MTRQKLREIANVRVPGWMILAGALLPLVAGIAGAARYAKGVVDHTYVRRDTFQLFQQGEALVRRTDSLHHETEIHDIHAWMADMDSSSRCQRGLRTYCR